ncbi:MAG: hypothetical protein U0V54_05830 [Saprospiraceae bacterium]
MIALSSISPYFRRIALVTFLLLTPLIQLLNHFFYIDEYIAHPQFEKWNHWAYCVQEIQNSGKEVLFFGFFFLDLIWAACLLYLMYSVVFTYMRQSALVQHTYFSFLRNSVFIKVCFLTAYGLDVAENTLYLLFYTFPSSYHSILEWLAFAKTGFYILLIIWFLWANYRKFQMQISADSKNYRPRLYLKALWISITIMVIIIFLLTKMEQGASLIIDMLDNPLQTSMVIFWMYVLYTILSHYPVYLFHRYFKASDGQSKPESWSMYTDILKFGITYFDKNKLHQIKGNDALLEYNKNDNNFTPYRKFIGGALYLSMVYCLLFTYGKYYGQPLTTKAIITLFTLPLLLRILHKWLLEKINDDYLTIYTFVLWLAKWFSVILGMLLFVFSHLHGWYWTTFWTAVAYFLVTGLSHIMTKTASNEKKIIDQENKLQSKKRFNYFNDKLNNWKFSLNNYQSKLVFIKYSGLAALVIFLLAHCPHYAWRISPIVILMVYLHLVYGTIVILVKYNAYAYEHFLELKTRWKKTLALTAIYSILPVAAYFAFQQYFMSEKSKISHLNQVPEADESSIISLDDFLKEKACQLPVKYYVSSWGGGLRATYFNFLMLNKLDTTIEGGLIHQTVAMSGVSGGMLGLGFHFAATKEAGVDAGSVMDAIGAYNFVSTDLAYLLGRDQVPINKKPWLRDRSITGMLNYWRILKQDALAPLDQTPYDQYWSEYVKDHYYPVLITNTTKSSGNYGVAVSARVGDLTKVIPGSTNILKLDPHKTLPFMEAISTTERFPLFSATATIEGLGHFIDGGYFENSGLLSLMNFRDYAQKIFRDNSCRLTDSLCFNLAQDQLIIIANSKENYISTHLDKYFPKGINIKIDGESDYASIGKGVLNTDRLANHLQTYYSEMAKERNIRVYIYTLPYKVNYNEVLDELGGEPRSLEDIEAIRDHLKKKNQEIFNLCELAAQKQNFRYRSMSPKWDFAYPTLSRLLSRPTINYYKAMVAKHPDL